MRTRYKSLADYGVPPDQIDELKARCKNLTAEERMELFKIAISASAGMEVTIYASIVDGIGYRTLMRRGFEIPAKEDDWYAYRRKTMALMYQRLKKAE